MDHGRSTTKNRTTNLGAAAAAIAAAAGMILSAAPAEAGAQAGWPNDTFRLCDYRPATTNCDGQTIGGIIWGNRTSTLQGRLIDHGGTGTTVFFDAFAGATKVDSDTRHVAALGDIPYNFVIGDSTVPGGVDRVRVQVCRTGTLQCSVQINVKRDAVAENWDA